MDREKDFACDRERETKNHDRHPDIRIKFSHETLVNFADKYGNYSINLETLNKLFKYLVKNNLIVP